MVFRRNQALNPYMAIYILYYILKDILNANHTANTLKIYLWVNSYAFSIIASLEEVNVGE